MKEQSKKSQKSTQIRKHTQKRQNNNFRNKLINSFDKDVEKTVSNLRNLYRQQITTESDSKFQTYLAKFKPFDSNVQGRSGSIVGTLSDMPNIVMKIDYYKKRTKPEELIISSKDKCLMIDNRINEIFANIILSSPSKELGFTGPESTNLKKYFLPVIDSGFTNQGSYLLIPLVGIELQNGKYITNLKELLEQHLKIISKNNNPKIKELYGQFLVEKLSKFFSVLEIMQKKLNFVSTDLKLGNIFIRKTTKISKKFSELDKIGLITNFDLLFTDLEKTVYNVNGIDVLTIPNNSSKDKILKILGYDLLKLIRHQCGFDYNKFCKKTRLYDYDKMMVMINILTTIRKYHKSYFKYLVSGNSNYMSFFRKTLRLSDKDEKQILKIINQPHIYPEGYSTSLNIIIAKFCKK